MPEPKVPKTRRYLRLIAGNVLILFLLLIIIEGLSSYALLIADIAGTRGLAERRHTEYDPDLGWINEPNVFIPDMYRPGASLRTNSQRFRNNRDFDKAVPRGKCRIICCGDSFTLGYGVGNDDVWCEQLARLDPRLETVNMGQGGYGVDQAYLWYKRDAAKLDHQVVLLSLVTCDFDRMAEDNFGGYGKPVLAAENDKLVVRNVPVPRRAYRFTWFVSNYGNFRSLRVAELLSHVRREFGPGRADAPAPSNTQTQEAVRSLLRKLLQDMKRLTEARSSKLVLVYLPLLDELVGEGPKEWTAFVETESKALGVPFINIVSKFRSLPIEDAVKLYILSGQLNYQAAAGHFNERGNTMVARMIYDELRRYPGISHMLSGHREPQVTTTKPESR